MSLPDAPIEPTLHATETTRRGSRPWLIALPAAVIVLAAIGWTGAWYYASARATAEIDAWIAAEAGKGRAWNCADRQLGGFPFRFELICTAPTLSFAGAGEWKASAARAHAVAQVWNPQHIIAEFEGPARLTEVATGRELVANWSLLQVSGVGSGGELDRLSWVSNDYTLAENGTTVFSARHTELHIRRTPDAAPGTFDIAGGAKGATGVATGVAGAGVDSEFEATVSGIPAFRPMPLNERLQLWQAAGGRVRLLEASVSGGGGALGATGEIGLDAARRPDGVVNLSLANAPALMKSLAGAGLMPEFLVNLAPAMMAVGMPGTLNGGPANKFPFVFRDGRVALGVLPLGKIGPLY